MNILSPLYTKLAADYYEEILICSKKKENPNLSRSEICVPIEDFINLRGGLTEYSEKYVFDFFGEPAILINDRYEKNKYSAIKKLFTSLMESKTLSINFLAFGKKISPFERFFLEYGLSPKNRFYSLVDLPNSIDSYKSSIRKSYKSLVNWGRRNLNIEIIDHASPNKELFLEFKNLHYEVSKKKTRSDKTWEIQYEMLLKNEGFLILGFLKDELVTGGYFFSDSKNVFYGSSASRRDLFDKGLMHSIIYEAINYSATKELQTIVLGDKLFNFNDAEKKLRDISNFKSGFSNQTASARHYSGKLGLD